MRYLIDGHNLIAVMKNISLDDPDDEVKLILTLRSWTAASRKRQVTVIFDGGLPGGASRHLSSAPVEVIFATNGQAADLLLINRIQAAQNPSEFTLVSNDREVVKEAERRKMPVVRSNTFAGWLEPESKEEEPIEEPVGPELSEDEVAEWLELFGPVPEITRPVPSRDDQSLPNSPKQPDIAHSSGAKKERKSPTILKSGERDLNSEEVDEWLKIFKRKGDK